MKISETYKLLYEKLGEEYQVDVAIGELGELVNALSKHKRNLFKIQKYGVPEYNPQQVMDKISEEIADVQNCIYGIVQHYGLEQQVDKYKNDKLLRTQERAELNG